MAGIKKGGPKRGLGEAIKKRRRGRGPYAGVPLSKRPPPSPTPPGIGDDYGGGSDPGNGWKEERPPWGGNKGGPVKSETEDQRSKRKEKEDANVRGYYHGGPIPVPPGGIWGGSCPRPEEEILLANNKWIPAKDLQIGDEVATSKDPQKVIRVERIEDSPRCEVSFEDSDSIVTSYSHPYFVNSKGFVEVSNLEKGDVIGELVFKDKKPFSDGPVISLSVDKVETYMLQGGTKDNPVPALSHNKTPPYPGPRPKPKPKPKKKERGYGQAQEGGTGLSGGGKVKKYGGGGKVKKKK